MSNLYGRMPTKGFLDNVKVVNKDGSALGSPLGGFELSDFDSSGDPVYIGKIDKNGSWYISEINIISGTKKYINGTSDYSNNWSNRSILSYQSFNDVF